MIDRPQSVHECMTNGVCVEWVFGVKCTIWFVCVGMYVTTSLCVVGHMCMVGQGAICLYKENPGE
jgi:hypothetical protein